MIEAKVIADSCWAGDKSVRLTTVVAKYHRFILPEVNTHRAFSRNTASSRAIPVAKMIEAVERDPAMPVFWGKNQPGMSAHEQVDDILLCKEIWSNTLGYSIIGAKYLLHQGLHKQLTNRLIEPFMWTTQIISATDWDNFFLLRRPPGGKFDPEFPAQPEMQYLAIAIWDAIHNSNPRVLQQGEWHIPFIEEQDRELTTQERVRVSSARCARASYLTHDGVRDITKDFSLHDRLLEQKHMSPFEHQAVCMANWWRYGNFEGFRQYRHHIECEEPI